MAEQLDDIKQQESEKLVIGICKAIDQGVAAATIVAPNQYIDYSDEIRITFDGDAVLFSGEAEKIYQKQGLEAFTKSEKCSAKEPLSRGPFKSFLAILHNIQHQFSEDNCPIKTALVTARAAPAHERVIRTLRSWNIRIDQALFWGRMAKGAFLDAFGADVLFYDQKGHCDNAREHVLAAHVPHGVVNS